MFQGIPFKGRNSEHECSVDCVSGWDLDVRIGACEMASAALSRSKISSSQRHPQPPLGQPIKETQLPSGALLLLFFGEGFAFRVNLPKKDALFSSYGHWASEEKPYISFAGRFCFRPSWRPGTTHTRPYGGDNGGNELEVRRAKGLGRAFNLNQPIIVFS